MVLSYVHGACCDRFRYPERAINMLAFCFNAASIGYITRLVAGREAIACALVDTRDGPRSVLVHVGINHTNCILVFLLISFFSTSSCVWWVLLTLHWFLVVGMSRICDAMERHSEFLHVIAWTLPAIQSIAVLMDRSVDADELTGLCQVRGARSHLLFFIAPLTVFLVVGAAFLLAGFITLCRVGRSLEALTVRTGIFSVLYMIPAGMLLACYCYEQVAKNAASSDEVQLRCAVSMLEIACSLIGGIISGVWIVTRKTIHSWKMLFQRLCRRRRSEQPSSGSNNVVTMSGYTHTRSKSPPGHNQPPSAPCHRQYQDCHHHYHHHYHHAAVNID